MWGEFIINSPHIFYLTMIPETLQRKAKTILPILWRDYKMLDENSALAIKMETEIDFYEHVKEGRSLCIYTDKEKHELCRYKNYCEVKTE